MINEVKKIDWNKYKDKKKKAAEYKKIDEKILMATVPVFSDLGIKKNIANKKNSLGQKLNKHNLKLTQPYKKGIKIIRKAKKDGHFTLKSFATLYRSRTLVSYEFIQQAFKNNEFVKKKLLSMGYIIMIKKYSYNSYIVPYNKRKEFAKFINEYMIKDQQKNTKKK